MLSQIFVCVWGGGSLIPLTTVLLLLTINFYLMNPPTHLTFPSDEDTDEEDMETERIEEEIVFMDVAEMEDIQDML